MSQKIVKLKVEVFVTAESNRCDGCVPVEISIRATWPDASLSDKAVDRNRSVKGSLFLIDDSLAYFEPNLSIDNFKEDFEWLGRKETFRVYNDSTASEIVTSNTSANHHGVYSLRTRGLLPFDPAAATATVVEQGKGNNRVEDVILFYLQLQSNPAGSFKGIDVKLEEDNKQPRMLTKQKFVFVGELFTLKNCLQLAMTTDSGTDTGRATATGRWAAWGRKVDVIDVHIRLSIKHFLDIDISAQTFSVSFYMEAMWQDMALKGKGIYDVDEVRSNQSEGKLYLASDHEDYFAPMLVLENAMGPLTGVNEWFRIADPAPLDMHQAPIVCYRMEVKKGQFSFHAKLGCFPMDTQLLSIEVQSLIESRHSRAMEDGERLVTLSLGMGVQKNRRIQNVRVNLLENSNQLKRSLANDKRFNLANEYYLHEELKFEYGTTDPIESASNRSYPYLRISAVVARRTGYYFFRFLLPLFLISSTSITVFAIPQTNLGTRCGVVFVTLLTTVNFKHIVSDKLPRVGYLNFLDGYITAVMCAVILVICICVVSALATIGHLDDVDEYHFDFGFEPREVIVGLLILWSCFHVWAIVIGKCISWWRYQQALFSEDSRHVLLSPCAAETTTKEIYKQYFIARRYLRHHGLIPGESDLLHDLLEEAVSRLNIRSIRHWTPEHAVAHWNASYNQHASRAVGLKVPAEIMHSPFSILSFTNGRSARIWMMTMIQYINVKEERRELIDSDMPGFFTNLGDDDSEVHRRKVSVRVQPHLNAVHSSSPAPSLFCLPSTSLSSPASSSTGRHETVTSIRIEKIVPSWVIFSSSSSKQQLFFLQQPPLHYLKHWQSMIVHGSVNCIAACSRIKNKSLCFSYNKVQSEERELEQAPETTAADSRVKLSESYQDKKPPPIRTTKLSSSSLFKAKLLLQPVKTKTTVRISGNADINKLDTAPVATVSSLSTSALAPTDAAPAFQLMFLKPDITPWAPLDIINNISSDINTKPVLVQRPEELQPQQPSASTSQQQGAGAGLAGGFLGILSSVTSTVFKATAKDAAANVASRGTKAPTTPTTTTTAAAAVAPHAASYAVVEADASEPPKFQLMFMKPTSD